jgi:hypothetical protein
LTAKISLSSFIVKVPVMTITVNPLPSMNYAEWLTTYQLIPKNGCRAFCRGAPLWAPGYGVFVQPLATAVVH